MSLSLAMLDKSAKKLISESVSISIHGLLEGAKTLKRRSE